MFDDVSCSRVHCRFVKDSGASTTSRSSRPVIEICQVNHLPLILTLIDYEKAFGSIEANSFLSASFDSKAVHPPYLLTLADCYENYVTKIWLIYQPVTVASHWRRLRQGSSNVKATQCCTASMKMLP
ncbi:hypothetical protein KIN20_021609 [Parelaphostrongylus tenuis]|uniref:Reverse transcriptase domain-containing protein n=1 Tax=Parelaphostrongylus tenuis TaxID=148309 RepID=A0AAD5QRP5_PARTN|nr:hypothetical protein KIN20_021609 [Parelaphostrongylus tenuis]